MIRFNFIVKFSFLSLLFFNIILVNKDVQAHPGRTDSSGCHTCKTNCLSWGLSNGEYHCHNAKISAPQPKEPIKSVYGEDGTGYTKPAPEYKALQDNINNIKTSELNATETNDNSKNTSNAIKSTDNSDSSLGTLVVLSLIGGIGYFIGKKNSSK